jgi:type VII secretion integral membrane protein EccD
LTVYADSVRADLVLPASVPLQSLIPTIVDIVSGTRGYRAGSMAVRHQLSMPGHPALDLSKTLAELRIRDGIALTMTGSSVTLPAPHLDDPAEAISRSLLATQRRWTPGVTRHVAMLAAGWLAVVCAALLIPTACEVTEVRVGGVAVAASTSLVSLLAGAAAYRVFGDKSAGLALGLTACGFAAVAGALIVPESFGAPNALVAASASATSAAVMRAISCHTVTFTALAIFSAAAATAALVGSVITVPLHALCAASAAISLILIEVSAPVSIKLAGLSSQAHADPDQPALDSDRLNARAISARAWLTSTVIALSAFAALAAAVGTHPTEGPRLPGIAFAALTGGVLLLRSRAHSNLAMSLPLIIFGTVTVSAALVGTDAAYPDHTAQLAAVSIGLAALAWRRGFVNDSTAVSPIGQRGIELLEYLCLAAVLPLACWICGLYVAARGLNLPWV